MSADTSPTLYGAYLVERGASAGTIGSLDHGRWLRDSLEAYERDTGRRLAFDDAAMDPEFVTWARDRAEQLVEMRRARDADCERQRKEMRDLTVANASDLRHATPDEQKLHRLHINLACAEARGDFTGEREIRQEIAEVEARIAAERRAA